MSDPKAGIEAALYTLLDAACAYPVFNLEAAGIESAAAYVVFQAAGGSDEWWHGKKRGYIYDYEILGVSDDRNKALSIASDVAGAMTMSAALAPAGFGLVAVTRSEEVDYTHVNDGRTYVHHVGGIYTIEVEET